MDIGDTVTISEARFAELLNHERISKELNRPVSPDLGYFIKTVDDATYNKWREGYENWSRLISIVNNGHTVDDMLKLMPSLVERLRAGVIG